MVCLADAVPMEVLSGFILMFCRIWTQPSLKGHQGSSSFSLLFNVVAVLNAMLCITLHQTLVARVHIGHDHGACPWFAVIGVMARLLVGDMQGGMEVSVEGRKD